MSDQLPNPRALKLLIDHRHYAICQWPSDHPLPQPRQAEFVSITHTATELSVICPADQVADGIECELGWRRIEVEGPLEFSMVGVLAHLSGELANAGLSILAVATYGTDHLLVRGSQLETATKTLLAAGYEIVED